MDHQVHCTWERMFMLQLIKLIKKKDVILLTAAMAFLIIQILFDLKMPEYMSSITQLIQDHINAADKNDNTVHMIWQNCGHMFICTLIAMICTVLSGVILMKVSAEYTARLREVFYNKVQTLNKKDVESITTSSLITRSTVDVVEIGNFITNSFRVIVTAPLTGVIAISKISSSNGKWTASIAVSIVIMIIVELVIVNMMLKYFEKRQKVNDEFNLVVREKLSGLRIIRAFNASQLHSDKFEKVNSKYTNINLMVGRISLFLSPFLIFTMSIISILIYWIGASIINTSAPPEANRLFGDMIVFTSYGLMIVGAFASASLLFVIVPRAMISVRRINEVLLKQPMVKEGNGVSSTSETGTVEFRNVSFHYDDGEEDTLSDISFSVKKGETVAFIGSTGCGKTTLVELIVRSYDPYKGEVLVDGVNVREYKKTELISRIGYASQKAVLFSGDLLSNLAFGDNTDDIASIKQKLEIAQCNDFIDINGSLSEHIAQNGSNLSGGQRQRVAIARALARNAEIFIFDDCFSALDLKTERELREEFKKSHSDSTCIIISQRIGTVIDADRIIVMDNGRIVGSGTHTDLISCCPVYSEIAETQLSMEGA